MKKHYHLENNRMGYPVGQYIVQNIPVIKEMAKMIGLVVDENYKRQYGSNSTQSIVLICKGSSGAIISALISAELFDQYSISIAHVKKPGESSHSENVSSNVKYTESIYVIVDDFIVSGETMISLIDKCQEVGVKPHILCITGEIERREIYEAFDYVISGDKDVDQFFNPPAIDI
jgi:adenine/guanine phosphoribosyltransferase-like PRPP-binding protein